MADRSLKPGGVVPGKFNGAYSFTNAFPPPDYDDDEPRRSRLRCCCCCFFSTLLSIVLVLGVAALVVYLVFKPKIPKYSVEDVKIQMLNVTGSNQVNTDISLSLRANNPNSGFGIKYQSISSKVYYRGTELGSDSIPSFYQGKRNVTVIHSVIHGSKVQVPSSTAGSLKSSISQKSSIPLVSVTKVKAKIRVGKLQTPAVWIRVTCNLRLTAPGAQGGARLLSKDCKISRWK